MTKTTACLALGLATLLTACSTSKTALRAPAPPDTDWSKAETMTVKLTDFDFAPSHLSLKVRTPLRLILVNDGSGDHDFSAPEFFQAAMYRPGSVVSEKGNIVVAEKETKEVDLMPIATGKYKLECTEFLHSLFGMTGSIDVVGEPSPSVQ